MLKKEEVSFSNRQNKQNLLQGGSESWYNGVSNIFSCVWRSFLAVASVEEGLDFIGSI